MSRLLLGILLGALQGLGEFLPVSSSGHLAVLLHFTGWDEHRFLPLIVALHLATTLAVLVYFRDRIGAMFRGLRGGPGAEEGRRMVLLLVAGSIPTALIGIILKEPLEALFTSPWATVVGWTVTGILLVAAEHLSRDGRSLPVTVPAALAVGVAQGVAIVPGISRSGATIAVALMLGVAREDAFAFSFLLSLPAVLGAMIIEGELGALAGGDVTVLAAGVVTAFALGLAALAWLSGLVRRGRLLPFSLYCWVAAAATGTLLASR